MYEFHGKFVLTPGGIVFVIHSPITMYDAEYLFRQFLKCDAHVELQIINVEGVKPNLVFPFVREVSQDD
jgi:hypothetical protein